MARVFKNDKNFIMMVVKNILLLYIFPHHHGLVERLSDEMTSKGLTVDVLCVDNYEIYKKSNFKYPKLLQVAKFLKRSPNGLISRLFFKLFTDVLLISIVKRYAYVDFHSFYPIFYKTADYCIANKIKYDITFWGSDLLRADDNKKQTIKKYLDSCHLIKAGMNLINEVKRYYKGLYDEKTFFVDFGNNNFSLIDELSDIKLEEVSKSVLNLVGGEITVMCGYNGISKQNHKFMIEQIQILPPSLKNRIHVILPMTYGCDDAYRAEVRACIEQTGIKFTLLDTYLSATDMSCLRKLTNVVINIQETDAFSLSLQEHFYCGAVMIIGDWLKYPEAKSANIYFIETKKERLQDTLKLVLCDYEGQKSKSIQNKEKINKVFAWQYMSDKWAFSYKN